MKRLPLALVGCALVFPATADAKLCPSQSVLESYSVTNVSCSKGKKVIKEFFKSGSPAFGYTCKQKQYEGGSKTTCRKGDRKVVYSRAD